MTNSIPYGLTPIDLFAAGLVLTAWFLIGWFIEHPPKSRPSVTVLMADYRRDWMRQFVTRSPRLFDANVIDSLRQGTAFFVSASMLAIGGGIALIGNAARLKGVAHDLTLGDDGLAVELKIILVLFFLSNSLLKFIWAHRLFGYCAILMAAVPNDPLDPLAYHRAAQSAEVNITAARSFNRGMRSIYFALAASSWILGAWALILATLITAFVLIRREFISISREVMLSRSP